MSFYQKHKHLIPLSAFPLLLVAIRIVYAQNLKFGFLVWNLFLAILPLYFSHRLKQSLKNTLWQQYMWAALWLLFFPNAAYIVTDLFHLHECMPVPLWFDLLLLFSTALNGLLAAFLSLQEVEQWMQKRFHKHSIKPGLLFLFLLSGFGIYLGRYLRWNSWDIVAHPFRLSRNIGSHIIYPAEHLQSWALSIFFGTWMYLAYFSFKKRKNSESY